MDLAKYTGTIPTGEDYRVRVTGRELVKTKAGDPALKLKVHFVDLDVDQQFFYPLTEKMLWKLQRDVAAAEVLREGDSYSDDLDRFADEIYSDLSDRTLLVKAEPQKSNPQFMDFEVTGVSLQ